MDKLRGTVEDDKPEIVLPSTNVNESGDDQDLDEQHEQARLMLFMIWFTEYQNSLKKDDKDSDSAADEPHIYKPRKKRST